MKVVSKSLIIVRIFAGGSLERGAEWQWGSRKRRCSDLSFEIYDSKLTLLCSNMHAVPRRLFSDSKMRDLEWPLGLNLCRASIRLPCLVYSKVPLSTYCKIRYISKFTASSRGSRCDGTAFLLRTNYATFSIDLQDRIVQGRHFTGTPTHLFCKSACRPFKVIQLDHWFWYKSKPRVRLPISRQQ